MSLQDKFTEITLAPGTIDIYFVRTSIFNFIKEKVKYCHGSLLDAGCGKMPYRDYILSNSKITKYVGLDIESAINYSDLVKPDVTWDGKKMPFGDNSFECAFATEVLEHVPEPMVFLNEIFRVLKQDGLFFFTVPFLWPLHEPPHDEFRYTPFAMERLLSAAGFSNISISALGGWNASLGQMIGLWLKRSPLSSRKKKIFQSIALPILKYLFKHDDPNVDFLRGPMVTGLSGSAYKK